VSEEPLVAFPTMPKEKMMEEKKSTAPAKEQIEETPYWGRFIVEIFKKLLGFNQLSSGIKKKF